MRLLIVFVTLSLIVSVGFTVHGLRDSPSDFEQIPTPGWILLGCVAILGAGLCAAALIRFRSPAGNRLQIRNGSVNRLFLLRVSLYLTAFSVLVTSGVFASGLFADNRDLARSFFIGLLWAALSAAYLRFFGIPHPACRSAGRKTRLWDLASANLILAVVLLEIALLTMSRIAPTRLLYDPTSVESLVSVYRLKPYTVSFDFTHSSRGYHDEEFFSAGQNDFVLALLADSFGVGIVPYDYNFATVAERFLAERLSARYDRVAVHNFGIPSVGMREYLYILDTEAMAYNPAFVVLCVFVGNDIDGLERRSRRSRFLIQEWLFARYIIRFFSIYDNMRGEGRGLWDIVEYLKMKSLGAAVREPGTTRDVEPAEDGPSRPNRSVPDYVHDWTKEKPILSEYAFMRWEAQRVSVCDTISRETRQLYGDFENALAVFQTKLGRRLLVVLIPDSFQVNDALWNDLMDRVEAPSAYDRDYPQKRIARYCSARGIRFLDLLSALRLGEAAGRTYHLRDTHWNAQGNRIAGEAIGRWVCEQVIPESEEPF